MPREYRHHHSEEHYMHMTLNNVFLGKQLHNHPCQELLNNTGPSLVKRAAVRRSVQTR